MLDLRRTIKLLFFLDMSSFSLTVADVCDLDAGGGAVHGHLPAAAGDGFPCSPTISEKLTPPLVKS